MGDNYPSRSKESRARYNKNRFEKHKYQGAMLTINQLFKHPDCKATSRQELRARIAAGKPLEVIMKGEYLTELPAPPVSQLIFDAPDDDSAERDRIKKIMAVPIRPETTQYGTTGQKFLKMVAATGSIRSREGSAPTELA
jgi:hypothetical protein